MGSLNLRLLEGVNVDIVDHNGFGGAVFMNLSNAFDSMIQDLLIAKNSYTKIESTKKDARKNMLKLKFHNLWPRSDKIRD